MRRMLFVLCVWVLATSTVQGQSAPAAEQTPPMKALLERIEKLEKRVEELEGRQVASHLASPADPKLTTSPSDPSAAACASPTVSVMPDWTDFKNPEAKTVAFDLHLRSAFCI